MTCPADLVRGVTRSARPPPSNQRFLLLLGFRWVNFEVASISEVDKYGFFRCMVRSGRGRNTGQDARLAVGS